MALDEQTLAKVWGVVDDPQSSAEDRRLATRVLERHGALGKATKGATPSDLPPKGYHERGRDAEPAPLAETPATETVFPGGGSTSGLGRKRAHTTTELEGDPIAQGLVGGAEGAVLAAPVAGLVGLASPAAGRLVGGAVSGGAATAAQGGDAMDVLKGAGLGALMAVPSAGRAGVRSAGDRVAARMQTDVTGGARSKAAKQVLAAGDALDEVYEAHPGLKKTLATGSTAEKANAVRAKLDELTEANDAATEAIAKHHGKISTDLPTARLQGLAERFEAAGDEIGRDAVTSTLETIDSFAQNSAGTLSAQQLRGIRNGLAKTIAKKAPGLPPGEAERAATAIKAELNETIADLAGKTPGVDVEALKLRNKQISALLPVQTQLMERAQAEGLAPPHDFTAEVLEPHGARKMAARKVREVRAKADYAIANNDTAKRIFGDVEPDKLRKLPETAIRAGAASTDDLGYAARVAQGMKAGMTLQQAVEAANTN
jgi:hypothetical protein